MLCYDTEEGQQTYNITGGVPQGSELRLLLWNLMYNPIFSLKLPLEAKVVGFADDIAVVVRDRDLQDLQFHANEAIQTIRDWLTKMGLSLAEQKTEVVLITSRRKIEVAKIRIGDHIISSKPSLKYLGVLIDSRLSFKYHIAAVTTKAANTCSAISRMMPNVGGPKHFKRLVISRVITSILLYGSPVWSRALDVISNKNKISAVYRMSALRVISAYRTVSDDAACVIAGAIPIYW